MDKKTAGAIIAILIIVIGGLRLTFALSEPLLDYDGYKELRLVEHISETGLPMNEDPLSYLGRDRSYSPIYHYLLAPWTYFIDPLILLKTLPNMLYVFSILLVYLIGFEISQHRGASIVAAVLSGLTPITFSQHINDASSYALVIPLLLLTLYALLRPHERLSLLIITSILLALISPAIFLIIGGLAFFLLITAIEKLTIDSAYAEILFFLLFFGLWSTLIIFKEAILDKGLGSLWDYIPAPVLTMQYTELTLLGFIAVIGALPLLFGGYASYHALFTRRAHRTLLVVSMAIATTGALFFRIIPIHTGLAILTFFLCILSAQGFTHLFRFFHKTRAPQIRYAVTGLLLFFFVFASALPALSEASAKVRDHPTTDHIAVAEWLAERDAVLLTTPHEGYYFEYAAGKPVFMDEEYFGRKDAGVRYEETATIYRHSRSIPVLSLLNRYGITHIVFSDEARKTYVREELKFLDDCFDEVYRSGDIKVYEVQCNVQTN